MQSCERYIISGRVQGVGFRAATASQARHFGICGWVRNLPDGRVEVLAGAESEALARFAEWLAQGPRGARVTGVERQTASGDDLPGYFTVR